jgi:hypothetical protein
MKLWSPKLGQYHSAGVPICRLKALSVLQLEVFLLFYLHFQSYLNRGHFLAVYTVNAMQLCSAGHWLTIGE